MLFNRMCYITSKLLRGSFKNELEILRERIEFSTCLILGHIVVQQNVLQNFKDNQFCDIHFQRPANLFFYFFLLFNLHTYGGMFLSYL